MSTRTCTRCGEDKPLFDFGVNRSRPDGLHYRCKACVNEANREALARNPNKAKQAYAKGREKYLAKSKEIRDALPSVQAARAARAELRESYSSKGRVQAQKAFNRMVAQLTAPVKAVERERAQEADHQRRLARRARHVAENPWVTHERRARKVPWAHWDDFAAVYTEAKLLTLATGVQWDVEHIYPIKADWVCGLHTPNNLRAVPHGMNRAKGLKVDIREWAETWLNKSRVFDSGAHTQSWLEAFATTSGKFDGASASDLLRDMEEALAHDMIHRLAD